jgi:taurine dioxygenase
MDMPVSFTVKPLSAACGAEIIGLDLSRNLPQQTIDEIRKVWNEYIVLVFRNQDITEDEQLAFAARFGALGARKTPPEQLKERSTGVLQTNPNVMLVSNMKVDGKPVGAFGDGDMWFHIDSGYAERPYRYTFLYGVKLPSRGGNTRFANMYRAYEALPQEMKDKLAGRKALHIHEYERRARVDIRNKDISQSPHWFHPVFVTHPETGRKSLFVDRLMTRRIEGLDPDDSEATLEFLYGHAEREDFIFEHEWLLGDVVAWDNLCSVHGRTWFPENEERLLRRCTIEGEPLFE